MPRRKRIRSFSNDSLTFDVIDAGPIDGPVVVLLHGFPERASHWEAVSEILHEHGLRTLAPDQRGYSPGARPRGRGAYRMSRLVADVVALADASGGPVHLVGHDWGAAVAWVVSATRSDRVRTLTAVSVPHPGAFLRSLVTSTQALRSWYVLAFQPPGLVEAIAQRAPWAMSQLLRNSGLDEAGVARFHEEIVEYGALPGALGWYRAMPLLPFPSVGPVRVPTTHVWSDGDSALARRGAELTGDHVEAAYELRVLAGVTHWVPTQAPEALAAAVLGSIDLEVSPVPTEPAPDRLRGNPRQ